MNISFVKWVTIARAALARVVALYRKVNRRPTARTERRIMHRRTTAVGRPVERLVRRQRDKEINDGSN